MRNCLRCSLMDIANVVFVCGRQMRRDDPFLEVGNAMYSYTVKRFSFSFLQLFVPNLASTCDSARLSNLYIASSETVFIHTTKVVFLSCAHELVLSVARLFPYLEIHSTCADRPFGTDEQEQG